MRRLSSKDIKVTLRGCATRFIKRCAGEFKYRRHWLNRTQWYSAAELKELQLELLKRVVKHAYETVPYYSRLMRKLKLRPWDVKNLEDIQKFPIMCKADLKTAGNGLVSQKFNRLFLRMAHTGGTTGLPVPLRRDLWSIRNEHAFVRRQYDWAGISLRDRTAHMMWRVVTSPNKKFDRPYMYDAAMKELVLSAFHLSPDTVATYVKALAEYEVRALVAYASAAVVLAKGCLDKGITAPVKCVLTTAETLDDAKRNLISKAFNCKVYDFYGSAERVCYIHTCEKGSYHIIPEYGLTELLPAGPPNEDCCRIVATGFWNMAMPLIRYDMGDLVMMGDGVCPCGRNFPVVKRIMGRESDVITTPSRRTLGATAIECILAHVLYGMYEMPVLAGQVIQEGADRVVLEYVPTDGFSRKDADRLHNLLREKLPKELKVNIRSVNKMNQTPSGKYLSFVMDEHH